MAHVLYRLGRTAYRRWPVFILGWLLLLGAVGGFAASQSKPFVENMTVEGMPSLNAAQTQKELFPGVVSADKQVTGQVVVQAPPGHTLSQQPYRAQVDTLVAALQRVPQLPAGTKLANPADAGPALTKQLTQAAAKQGISADAARKDAAYLSPLSADGRTGIISWNFDVGNQTEVEKSTQDQVLGAVGEANAGGLQVAAAGTGMSAFELGHTSEIVGIGFALVILLFTLGSLVAAGLPILSALVGVGLGGMLVTSATHFWDLTSNTPVLASMVGLAVGIDYALFILSRYRAELARTGDREHAIGLATGTAGSAVVFAGLTVVIALTALYFSGISVLASMGYAAAATVVLAVLVAISLLPAVLGMLKGRAFAGRIRRSTQSAPDDAELVNGSVRLGRGIRRAPWAVVALLVVGLGLLAGPVKDLHLGLPSDATAAKDTQARHAADMITDGWGPGQNAPMIAVLDNRSISDAAKRQSAISTATQWLAGEAGVANAQVVQTTKDMSGAVVLVTPTTGPADEATDDLLTRLHDGTGAVESGTGTRIGITGLTAIAADFSQNLSDALPLYLGIVVGLAFLVLVLVFRSLVVPAVATIGFLLSVLATLGAMVLLVQHGDLGIFDPQPIMSLMPTLLIGIVFGLAMDYQVFLTTRVREAYVHGMEPKDAIIDGFRHSGRVITAAALIMISVFAAFAAQDNALIKSLGAGLALAIVIDAFGVRMLLVPALLNLLGHHAWWMPRWLDRILPNVDVEGAGLDRAAGPEESPSVVAAVATRSIRQQGESDPVDQPTSAPSAVVTTATTPPAGPMVHGTVTTMTGSPCGDARITITDSLNTRAQVVRTEADGSYQVHLPVSGTYLFVAVADGVAPKATLLTVTDQDTVQDITLSGDAWLTGRITREDPRSGHVSVVGGAVVTVTDAAGSVVHTTRSGDDGTYTTPRLAAGQYVVTALDGDRPPASRSVEVTQANAVRCDMTLAGGGEVQGVVLGALDGLPVERAVVTLKGSDGSTAGSQITGPDGRYSFTDLGAGHYTVIASGYAPVAQEVDVMDGAISNREVLLGGELDTASIPQV